MKPVKLRFRGLHSYRSWQEVDFSLLSQSGLFGIFGPTGAGKSTVPDAITLALYGNVERAARGTQGIINLSEQSCEVAFTFALGGCVYTAQRLFKRVKGDPFSSKSEECRLLDECSGQVLADKANEMTALIEGLLGMDMQRFCQTVILPQGKFDRFLRLKPSERGNMLEEIFHLQEYGDALQKKAADLVKSLDGQIILAERELTLLGECAPPQIAAAKTQLAECRERLAIAAEVREKIQTAWQAAQALAAKEQERQEQEQVLQELLARETEMSALADRAEAAAKAAALKPLLEQVEARFKEQQQLEQAALAARQAEQAGVERMRAAEAAAQAEQADLEQQQEAARQAVVRAGEDSARLIEEEQRCKAGWQEADVALEQARMLHAAGLVAGHLRLGQPCPVCGSPVSELPADLAQGDIAAAEQVRQHAFSQWQQAGKRKEEAAGRLSQAQQRQLALNAALAEARGSEDLRQAREQANQAVWQAQQQAAACESGQAALAELKKRAVSEAQQAGFDSVNAARRALLSETELAQANDTLRQYRSSLTTARAQLERLTQQLTGFAAEHLPALRQELAQAENTWQGLLVEEAGRSASLAVLQENGLRWQELQGELAATSSRRDTARRLQKLVSGKALVRFLARERLRELAAEASHTVGMLSNQHFRLQLFEEGESGEFIIVDQYNGGQRRPVSTLSGGEIFLVSLSLALALSRNIEMQGEILGFFFLDEGFGTLDDETLETVMCILERLPSDKRLVGLISHVQEVRARLPRYLEALPADGPNGSVLRIVTN